MDLAYVKKLVKLLSESDVEEIEIEEEGKRVRLSKHSRNNAPVHQTDAQVVQVPTQQPPPLGTQALPASSVPTPPTPAEHQPPVAHHEIRSPIVGTFYRAPAPDAAPFVEVGSSIEPGTVLCIVEAMKLMNEIESDVAGEVVKKLVANGQPIEYGQELFAIRPRQ
jgi:acetyl-CoA carboxylase biotin carboxyl carrier protein